MMKMPRKIGPKSIAQNVQDEAACSPSFTQGLGDESVNSDSSSPYDSTALTDGSGFRSPELANEADTDYGFDFTGSCAINRSVPEAKNSGEDTPAPNKQQSVQDTGTKSVGESTVTNIPRKPTVKTTPVKSTTTTIPQKSTVTTAAKSATTKKKHQRKQMQPQRVKKAEQLSEERVFLVQRRPFSLVVREIMQNRSTVVTQITESAMEALQVSTEAYLIQRLQDAYLLTIHRGRLTLSIQDMLLIKLLRTLNHS